MVPIGYLDFDLSIEQISSTEPRYRARVLNSPAGQAVVDFQAPFSKLELENFLLRIGRPRQGVRRLDSPEMDAAEKFGDQLFKTVFQGQVLACLARSVDNAGAKGLGLRIHLRLNYAAELVNLPWEYLYDSTRRRFLVLSEQMPIIRYLDLPDNPTPLKVALPLKILVMIANPEDSRQLDVEAEWKKIENALDDLIQRGLVTLTRMEEATISALQRRLRQEQYHIFHYIGHGGFDQQTMDGVLILEDEKKQSYLVSGQHLGTLLHDHLSSLRLVILNACEGARTELSDPFAGVAQHLMQQNIAAVIAMQFEITDKAAVTLSHEFYTAIADGYPIDAALSAARKAIYIEGNDIEWGIPVLHMRTPDGQLFDVAPIDKVKPPPILAVVEPNVEHLPPPEQVSEPTTAQGQHAIVSGFAYWRNILTARRHFTIKVFPAVMGFFIVAVFTMLFFQQFRCVLEFRITEATVALITLLTIGAGIIFSQLLSPQIQEGVRFFYGGFTIALLLVVISVKLLPPPFEAVCSSLQPADENLTIISTLTPSTAETPTISTIVELTHNPTLIPSGFEFSVRVSDIGGHSVPNAIVFIEVAGKNPLQGVTDKNGYVPIWIPGTYTEQTGRLFARIDKYESTPEYINLYPNQLAKVIEIDILSPDALLPTPTSILTPIPTTTAIPTLSLLGSQSVKLGDLDNDGDLDLFLGKIGEGTGRPDEVWLNQGGVQGGAIGVFQDSGQRLGNWQNRNISLGDIDNDGDLDGFAANAADLRIQIWRNNGTGKFRDGGLILTGWSQVIALGDLDGDKDLDGIIGNDAGLVPDHSNEVWFNSGGLQGGTLGTFEFRQTLRGADSLVALGDVDGDNDLDVVISNGAAPTAVDNINTVWFNDGKGNFTNSNQILGSESSVGVELGDIDSDGDLDVLFPNDPLLPTIWLNKGNGEFSNKGQSIGNSDLGTKKIALGDLDTDGDLDALTLNHMSGSEVWLNDGKGQFYQGQILNNSESFDVASGDVALGDIDQDGDLDVFLANLRQSDELWLNDGNGNFTKDSMQQFDIKLK